MLILIQVSGYLYGGDDQSFYHEFQVAPVSLFKCIRRMVPEICE
jgi:hypothetical protein